MRTYLDCLPCLLQQALEAARVATDDESIHREVMTRVSAFLAKVSLDKSPPDIGRTVHAMIRDISGNEDPYADKKRYSNEHALSLLPDLRTLVQAADDPLHTAVRLAVAGNVIDFGARGHSFDLEDELKTVIDAEFGICHYQEFKQDILQARTILYLGDNAGEIMFDRLLVEVLLKSSPATITFVVRGSPVLNDATLEDAHFAGLDKLVRVIENGSDAPATLLSEVTPQVRDLFENVDLIISKGQGNCESLFGASGNIYFLLKVKCPIMAKLAGAESGRYLLAHRASGSDKEGFSSIL